jgi:5'-nucleotidase
MKTAVAMCRSRTRLLAALATCALALLSPGCRGQAQEVDWPTRVLLTNDNGIDDTGLVELARAFARVPGTEVVVVAATEDRSGTSNFMGATREREYRVERRNLGPGIEAWALDGYPADCVIFALSGPLRERPPDVVISGINGGPNLGDDWFGSGTIGAARTAAYFGLPAVAVSGVEDDDPAAVELATSWVVDFVRSGFVAALEAPEYLTVSLPVQHPDGIQGARIVERARGLISGEARRVAKEGQEPGAIETWRLEVLVEPDRAGGNSDVRAVQDGYVAIVPMRADESDTRLLDRLGDRSHLIPSVPRSPAPVAACPIRLGVTIDDVEDPDGREWGVFIETVEPASVAERSGLQEGDVVVTFNGVGLETRPGEGEDPDDRFGRLLREVACGDSVHLRLVRDRTYQDLSFTLEPNQ